jgi:hypothetical protein
MTELKGIFCQIISLIKHRVKEVAVHKRFDSSKILTFCKIKKNNLYF